MWASNCEVQSRLSRLRILALLAGNSEMRNEGKTKIHPDYANQISYLDA